MKKDYVLINKEKLNMNNCLKWLLLIVSYVVCLVLISVIEILVSNLANINVAKIEQITFYLRAFCSLSLIHDIAPSLKKSISIIYSLLLCFLYINVDFRAGDKLFLGALLFMIIITAFNVYLYKEHKN